jgi:hypothetical protein
MSARGPSACARKYNHKDPTSSLFSASSVYFFLPWIGARLAKFRHRPRLEVPDVVYMFFFILLEVPGVKMSSVLPTSTPTSQDENQRAMAFVESASATKGIHNV